jgi:membrane protein YdbS with pleckstrin-like domain
MHDPSPTPPSPEPSREASWTPLPDRALFVHLVGELFGVIALTAPLVLACFLITATLADDNGLAGALALGFGVVGLGIGLFISYRRFRWMRWRLDSLGIWLRHGRLWQHETQVPITRVQHLDLTRGPLQQANRLATLVVYTAGSKHGALSLANLDEGDAERLRDRLGRQIDQDAA